MSKIWTCGFLFLAGAIILLQAPVCYSATTPSAIALECGPLLESLSDSLKIGIRRRTTSLLGDRILNRLFEMDDKELNEELQKSGQLNVPYVLYESNIRPKGETTTTEVIYGSKDPLDDQLKLNQFANHWFGRRAFASAEFLSSREKVFTDFADRSLYLGVYSHAKDVPFESYQEYLNRGKLQGIVGVTYATGTREIIENIGKEEFLSRKEYLLGMETTLGIPVTRYYDSQGRSVVLEYRTYAKDPASTEHVKNALISDGITMGFYAIKNYPELYDKPIIYTYGDELSVRFYGLMGFKIQEHLTPKEHPIKKDGTNWWVLAITPREFEKLLLSIHDQRHISNLNQSSTVVLPNGIKTTTVPGTSFSLNRNGISNYLVSAEDVEVTPGFTAAANSRVVWDWGGIRLIEHIGKGHPYIPAGARIEFAPWEHTESGLPSVREISLYGKAMTITDLNITVTDHVSYGVGGKNLTQAIGLLNDTYLAPGLVAAKGSNITISYFPKYKNIDITLAEPYETHDGVYSTGTPVIIKIFPNQKMEVWSVYRPKPKN